ncbi:4Fe-4S ferredoxin [Candidatus Bathyarchaeota archaeon]|jgi:NAD-dependent dihydropyrimidine dehydrogenase PreA subunit|nr:4Fe-4S ferredoxin [Candidatus Bathyarchaeota archaeon]MDP6048042.1 ferredoxin family protein [Candidatus Bathyarchaeota archaeon]MDP6458104.1 ferredoxin family protein [Candidatus Bathyarchaeota archaeon]MDP7443249.1 ferredoxin family protein [Candidatus Bathyarchaeota archaeon]
MVRVIVDRNLCNGDCICADICPMNVFDILPSAEHNNEDKSFAPREEDCIQCMACVSACPTQAIIVED